MTSMEGFSSGIADDHAPLWKYITKVKKLKREEIDEESIVIALKDSMTHAQESMPIS